MSTYYQSCSSLHFGGWLWRHTYRLTAVSRHNHTKFPKNSEIFRERCGASLIGLRLQRSWWHSGFAFVSSPSLRLVRVYRCVYLCRGRCVGLIGAQCRPFNTAQALMSKSCSIGARLAISNRWDTSVASAWRRVEWHDKKTGLRLAKPHAENVCCVVARIAMLVVWTILNYRQRWNLEFDKLTKLKEADDVKALTAAGWFQVLETPFATYWASTADGKGIRCDIAARGLKKM